MNRTRADRTAFVYFSLAFLLYFNWLWLSCRSLWIDEFRSFHAINGDFSTLFHRTVENGVLTPLSYIPSWISMQLFGAGEFMLRLPSVLCLVVASLFLFHLVYLALGLETAFAALLIFMAGKEVTFAASMLRSYAMAIMFGTASLWSLYRWINEGKRIFQIGTVLFSGLMFYAHPLSALLYLVHPLFFVLVKPRARRVTMGAIAAGYAGLLMMGLLVYKPFFELMGKKSDFSWLEAPQWGDFFSDLYYPLPLLTLIFLCAVSSIKWARDGFSSLESVAGYVFCCAALFITHPYFLPILIVHGAVFFRSKPSPEGVSKKRFWTAAGAALAAWAYSLTDPVLYWPSLTWLLNPTEKGWIYSRIILYDRMYPLGAAAAVAGLGIACRQSARKIKNPDFFRLAGLFTGCALLPYIFTFGSSISGFVVFFVPRYYIVWQIGFSVACAIALSLAAPAVRTAALILLVSASVLHSHIGLIPFTSQDWRSAVRYASGLIETAETPVLLDSGFIESESPEWLGNPELRAYLLSPLEYYPVKGIPRLFPKDVSKPAVKGYLSDLAPLLQTRDQIVFLTLNSNKKPVDWIAAAMGAQPLSITARSFKAVRVYEFKKG